MTLASPPTSRPQVQAHSLPSPTPRHPKYMQAHTLVGSIPMLSTDGLPPLPPPLKASRLTAESLPKYGQLPAPKIPPVIGGATVLASICGARAVAATERTPQGMGWLPICAYSPLSLRLASKGQGGLLSQTCPLQEKSILILPGKIQLHSRVLFICSLPLLYPLPFNKFFHVMI